jgi:hypothetical protein
MVASDSVPRHIRILQPLRQPLLPSHEPGRVHCSVLVKQVWTENVAAMLPEAGHEDGAGKSCLHRRATVAEALKGLQGISDCLLASEELGLWARGFSYDDVAACLVTSRPPFCWLRVCCVPYQELSTSFGVSLVAAASS